MPSPQAALLTLLKAFALRDRQTASRLLAESPQLALLAVDSGATRLDASSYLLRPIGHYIYAGDTALHIASAAYLADIARELLAQGAKVSARNRRGAEPLHYAADGGPGSPSWDPEAQYAVIELLIRAGANPDSADKNGVAPLHRAVRTRCTGAVRALLKSGAAPRLKNGSGSTPLHLAVQNTGRGGSGSAAAREQQKQIIRLLLEHGARPSDKNAAGKRVIDSVTSDWIRALLD